MYFLSISPYFSLNYQVSTYIVKCYVVLSTTFKRCVRKIYWSVHCTLFSNEYAWMSNEWKILMLNKKMLCGTFHFYLFQLHLKGLYAKFIGQYIVLFVVMSMHECRMNEKYWCLIKKCYVVLSIFICFNYI